MKKTQFGWVVVIISLIVEGLIVYQNANEAIIPVTILLSLILILFGTLTLNVTDEYVKFSFGIGLIRGKYKISNIEICWPMTYFPLGWGIRFRPGVILFNVSGNKAIKLRVKGKNREIWIGTSYPDEFAAFINSKMKKQPI